MNLRIVNVLTFNNFEEIYKIKEFQYWSLIIENFKVRRQIKQCCRCQGSVEASETSKFILRMRLYHSSVNIAGKMQNYI